MPTWPYTPQEVFTEALGYDVRRSRLPGGTTIVRPATSRGQRGFRLQFTTITSATCSGMQKFLAARRGGYEAFDFVNPNDQRAYRVRLQGGILIQHLVPSYFAAGGDLTFLVVDP